MPNTLKTALAFADVAMRTNDPAATTRAYRAVLDGFGLSGFACGELDLADPRRAAFVVTEFSREWLAFYTKEGVIDIGPIMGVLKSHDAPFTWSQLRREDPTSPVRRRIFGTAKDCGLTEGLVIPLPRGGSRRGLICLHGDRDDLTPHECKVLTAVSTLYYERVKGLLAGVQRPRTTVLTPREFDCQSYVAQGLNDAGIGEKLRIAPTTAHDHVERPSAAWACAAGRRRWPSPSRSG